MILTVTVADADAADVLEAFAATHRYRPTVLAADPKKPGGLTPAPNQETKEAFARRMLCEHVAKLTESHRRRAAEAKVAVQPVVVS